MKIASADAKAYEILQLFWQQEEVHNDEHALHHEDKQALDMFHSTVTRNLQGRLSVSLPRKIPPLSLGESRSIAFKRYLQNNKSLSKKDQWEAFHLKLDEYRILGHAELVPEAELLKPKGEVFYLPTHGVIKESSSTTKLRIVLDGSAISLSGHSLMTSFFTVLLSTLSLLLSLLNLGVTRLVCLPISQKCFGRSA